jgi:hypothetical protein
MSTASVLMFLPAGDCPTTNSFKVKVKVTLLLAVYRQSVRLRVKPLETHLFSTEHLLSYYLCNIPSDDKIGLSVTNIFGLFSS